MAETVIGVAPPLMLLGDRFVVIGDVDAQFHHETQEISQTLTEWLSAAQFGFNRCKVTYQERRAENVDSAFRWSPPTRWRVVASVSIGLRCIVLAKERPIRTCGGRDERFWWLRAGVRGTFCTSCRYRTGRVYAQGRSVSCSAWCGWKRSD